MRQHLQRVLNGYDVFCIAFGAMIGWSWVVLAGVWLSDAGLAGAVIAFLVGSVIVALIGLTYAELASALPYAGGEHVYVERAFGPAASFVATWAIVLGYVSVVAFEAIALPVALVYLFPDLRQIPLWEVAGYRVHLTEVLIGAGAAISIALLNVVGIRSAARGQQLAVLLIVIAGAVLIAGGIADAERAAPELWNGWEGVAGVLIMVPFLFVGFDVIPQSAEEIDIPRRRIGILLVVSIAVATLFYIGVVLGVGAAAPPANAPLATAAAASALWGSETVGTFIIVAGVAGIVTSWNAFLIGGSRALFAMARAGQLPAVLADVHPRFGTPYRAIALIGALSALAPMLGRSALVWIVNAGGFAIVIAYVFVTASFLALRKRAPGLERPYRTPNGMIVGASGLVLSLALAVLYLPGSPAGLSWPEEWGIVAGWVVLGIAGFAARALAWREAPYNRRSRVKSGSR